MMEKEKKYLEELILIEEEISMNKIKALELLETNTAKETKISEEIAEKQRAMLEENERYLKEKLEMNLFLTKQRELSEKIELDTNEKLRQLRMQRSREDVSLVCTILPVCLTCRVILLMLLCMLLSCLSFTTVYLCMVDLLPFLSFHISRCLFLFGQLSFASPYLTSSNFNLFRSSLFLSLSLYSSSGYAMSQVS
jgi:hypothetical protein